MQLCCIKFVLWKFSGKTKSLKTLLKVFEQTHAVISTVELLYEQGKEWLSQNVPTARVLPIFSHAMFWERSEEFNKILERFLEINR